MTEDWTRLTLRIPAPLRDQLVQSAETSRRSMNGEIVYQLEAHMALNADAAGKSGGPAAGEALQA